MNEAEWSGAAAAAEAAEREAAAAGAAGETARAEVEKERQTLRCALHCYLYNDTTILILLLYARRGGE